MKRILLIVAGVVALLLVAALAVPFLVPSSVYKAQIEKAATKALQRDVALTGDVSVSVFPRITASVEGVTVANPEGFDGAHMVTADALRGSVKWGPLLSRRVDVQELAFENADVKLQRLADGRTNWEFGTGETTKTDPETGKSGQLDAGIERARLVNANVSYRDAMTGAAYDLKDFTAEASVRGMDKPLKANGAGLFQEQNFKFDLSLDSPEAALGGNPAAADVTFTTDLGDVAYKGTLTLGETPALEGDFSLASEALAEIAGFADIDVPMDLARLGKIAGKGRVSGPVSALKVDVEEFTQNSDLMTARYVGALRLGDAPTIAGDFDFNTPDISAVAKFADVEMPYNLAPLGSASVKAKLSGALTEPKINFESVGLKGALIDAVYKGAVTLGEDPVLDGALTAKVSDIGGLTQQMGVEVPYNLAPLGAANVDASLSGPVSAMKVYFQTMTLKSDLLDAAYTGRVMISDRPELAGNLKANVANVGELARQMGVEVPAQAALETLDVQAGLLGMADTLSLNDVKLKHTGALLNAEYSGNVSMAGEGAVKGDLKASSTDLRALLEAADVELAPGETLKTFSMDGAVDGTLKTIAMPRLTLVLDEMNATGSARADMTGDVPVIGANLAMPKLDLTPFMGEPSSAPKPQGQSTAWSKEPLDLAGLKAVNADITLTAGEIIIGKTRLTDAALTADLKGGRMTADMSKFQAFGGNWGGNIIVNAQNSGAPIISFNMKGDGILASEMLNTFAGIDRLTGQGAFQFKGAATGNSIHDIMNGLDGTLSADLSDGALKGINVGQLVRSAGSLREALQTGSLNNLNFTNVLSPSAETDFTEFDAVLKIEDGVAQVDILKLLNPVLGLDGTGEINLGGQSLDIRLATSIDQSGSGSGSVVQLNGIPVPVRISGTWNDLKLTPDLSGVRQALIAEASGRVRDEVGGAVRDQIGGDVGNVLGDVLGLPRGEAPPAEPQPVIDPAADPKPDEEIPPVEEEEEPETVEEAVEDLAKDALKDLFGRGD